jgi:hypothetical protein
MSASTFQLLSTNVTKRCNKSASVYASSSAATVAVVVTRAARWERQRWGKVDVGFWVASYMDIEHRLMQQIGLLSGRRTNGKVTAK